MRHNVTTSFGVSSRSPEVTPGEDLIAGFLHSADVQRSRAKQAGKNRVSSNGYDA